MSISLHTTKNFNRDRFHHFFKILFTVFLIFALSQVHGQLKKPVLRIDYNEDLFITITFPDSLFKRNIYFNAFASYYWKSNKGLKVNLRVDHRLTNKAYRYNAKDFTDSLRLSNNQMVYIHYLRDGKPGQPGAVLSYCPNGRDEVSINLFCEDWEVMMKDYSLYRQIVSSLKFYNRNEVNSEVVIDH